MAVNDLTKNVDRLADYCKPEIVFIKAEPILLAYSGTMDSFPSNPRYSSRKRDYIEIYDEDEDF